jgi:hypothetical protein
MHRARGALQSHAPTHLCGTKGILTTSAGSSLPRTLRATCGQEGHSTTQHSRVRRHSARRSTHSRSTHSDGHDSSSLHSHCPGLWGCGATHSVTHLAALRREVLGHVTHGDGLVQRGAEGAARHLADLPHPTPSSSNAARTLPSTPKASIPLTHLGLALGVVYFGVGPRRGLEARQPHALPRDGLELTAAQPQIRTVSRESIRGNPAEVCCSMVEHPLVEGNMILSTATT